MRSSSGVAEATPSPTPRTGTAANPGGGASAAWTSSSPVLIGPQSNVDFDSIPPDAGSGADTVILYAGNELYTVGSIKIATWTENFQPSRDKCNALAQAQEILSSQRRWAENIAC